ncbi:hypothetical protein [Streptomyces yanii]|uniref:Uncharacterized protein n=1 Tax=Streptomyces yanii TaxID=78510 RepID=A0ABV5RJN1_9ACTN
MSRHAARLLGFSLRYSADDDTMRCFLEGLGFGAGEVTALVTGVVWLAPDQTVRQLGDRAADCALHGARNLLRRVFRRHAEPATGPSLTLEQLAEVRQRVLEVAARRGLERERAETVADAVVARVALGAAGR